MSWHHRLSIRLLVPLALTVALATAGSLVTVSLDEKARLVDASKDETSLVSTVIEVGLHAQMLKDKETDVQTTLVQLGHTNGLRQVTVLDRQGRVAYSSHPDRVGQTYDQSDPTCQACHSEGGHPSTDATVVQVEEGDLFRAMAPVHNHPECQTCHGTENEMLGVVLVDRDVSRQMGQIATARGRLALIGLATVGVVMALLLGLVGMQVLRPVKALRTTAQKLSQGELSARVGDRFEGEFGALARAFDDMAQSIQSQIREINEKSFELSVLYQMVEKLSKSIDPRELRIIILEILPDVFKGIERSAVVVQLVENGEVNVSICEGTTGSMDHETFAPDQVDNIENLVESAVVRAWLAGEDTETEPEEGLVEMIVPIKPADRQLGFLYVRRYEHTPFSAAEANLLAALRGHLSIALENARLYAEATTDELTGTHTLRYFHKILDDMVARFERYGSIGSLLMLDLDDFKQVNDTYGHPAGDAVLREFARAMRDSVREVDVVCRYGGEEFAILLPESDEKAALAVAERVRRRMDRTNITYDGQVLAVTTSVGAAALARHARTAAELVLEADRALYRAKAQGKNRVVVADLRADSGYRE